MNALVAHEIKSALDADNALLNPIKPTMNPAQTLFDARHADFEVGQILDDAIDLFVDSPQANQNHALGFPRHNLINSPVPALFRKE